MAGNWKKRLIKNFIFSAIAVVLFFALLEGILRFFPETQVESPELASLFTELKSSVKQDNEFRVFCFGGSSTYGFHCVPFTSFPKCMDERLKRILPHRDIRVFNLGRSSYDISRVYKTMQASLKYKPDLLVVYSGHNEFLPHNKAILIDRENSPIRYRLKDFLETTRTYILLRNYAYRFLNWRNRNDQNVTGFPGGNLVRNTREKEVVQPGSWLYETVIRQFRTCVESIVTLAREHDIPLILCLPPSNEMDVLPIYAVHIKSLTTDETEQWDKLYKYAREEYLKKRYENALDIYQQALQLSPHHAGTNYYMGLCLLKLGRIDEAKTAFMAARDWDGIAWRITDRLLSILKGFDDPPGVIVCDVIEKFREHSRYGIIGDSLIIDNCHPSIEGHYLIASAIMENMAAYQIPAQITEWFWENDISYDDFYKTLNITDKDIVEILLGVAEYWFHAPFQNKQKAMQFLHKAERMDPSNPKIEDIVNIYLK